MSDKRRMFSATVVSSETFLFMDKSSQILYMQLCMNADDFGILNNARLVMRMADAKQKHLDELCQKCFAIDMGDGLHAITHWFMANQIKAGRRRESVYKMQIDKNLRIDNTGTYYTLAECEGLSVPVYTVDEYMTKVAKIKNTEDAELNANTEQLRSISQKLKCNSAKIEDNNECNSSIIERNSAKIEDNNECNSSIIERNSAKIDPQIFNNCAPGKDSIGKVRIDQNSIAKDSLNTHTVCSADTDPPGDSLREPAEPERVCVDCVCPGGGDSLALDKTPALVLQSDLPPSVPEGVDKACPPVDTDSLVADCPPATGDPPSSPPDALQVDAQDIADPLEANVPQELAHKAEILRVKLQNSGLRVPDAISWLMRDFKFALEGKRRLKLTDDEFLGGLDNYANLLAARKASPDAFWWSSTSPVPSLFTGDSPQILRFLPGVFDISSFKNKPKSRASTRRAIDSEYSLKAIAERQEGA